MVPGPQPLSHGLLERGLVVGRILEAHREGLHDRGMPFDQGGQDARIQPSAQVSPHGNIRPEPDGRRFAKGLPDAFHGLVPVRYVVHAGRRKADVPVQKGFSPSPVVDDALAGPDLINIFEYGPGRHGVPEGEDLAEAFGIDPGLAQHRGQGFDCGREHQARAAICIKQGRDAEPVARQNEPAGVHVPQGEGELAVEARQKISAVLLIEMVYHLNVACCGEVMTLLLELGAQLDVVEYLAVADHPDAHVFVRDGLIAGLQVDDGEPPVSQDDLVITVHPRTVGTSVFHETQARFHCGIRDPAPAKLICTGNSAHYSSPDQVCLLEAIFGPSAAAGSFSPAAELEDIYRQEENTIIEIINTGLLCKARTKKRRNMHRHDPALFRAEHPGKGHSKCASYSPYPSFFRSSLGMKRRDAEFMQ